MIHSADIEEDNLILIDDDDDTQNSLIANEDHEVIEILSDPDECTIEDDEIVFVPNVVIRKPVSLAQKDIPAGVYTFQYFPTVKDDHFILILPSGKTRFPVCSSLECLTLLGECEVFSYTLPKPSDNLGKAFTTICPASISRIVISLENRTLSASSKKQQKQTLTVLRDFCTEATLSCIEQRLSDRCCCVLLRKSAKPRTMERFFEKYFPEHRIFAPHSVTVNPSEPTVKLVMNEKTIHNERLVLAEMDYCCSEALRLTRDALENFVYAVCGPADVGKSTFVRQLANKMLSRSVDTFILDCDCGQTEFTLPGCLSLTRIVEPLFGDPYCHLREPELCYYFGNISPSPNVETYLLLIEKLVDHFKEVTKTRKASLIINTNGWIHGYGVTVLKQILTAAHVRRVSCLVTSTSAAKTQWVADLSACLPSECRMQSLLCKQTWSASKNGPTMRQLAVCSYFSDVLRDGKESLRLCSQPYIRPWCQLTVGVLHGHAPPDQVLSIMNANLVALCQSARSSDERRRWAASADAPFMYDDGEPARCVGFGVVRAVDCLRRTVCIVTPVPPEQMATVDVVLKGVTDLPRALWLNFNERLSAPTPYVDRSGPKARSSDIADLLESSVKVRSGYMRMVRNKKRNI